MYSFLLWVVVTWVFTSLSAHFFSVPFSVWMHTLVKIENPQPINSIITESYSPGPVLTALSRQCWWAKAHSQACGSLKDVISRSPRNVCFLGNPPWIVLLWLKLESRDFEVCPDVLPISIADPWCDDGMDISSRRQGASLVLIWIHMTSCLWWKLPKVSLVMGHMFPGCRQGPESLPPLSMAVGDLGWATPKLESPPASERPLSTCKHTHAQTPRIMCSAEWTGFFRRRLWKGLRWCLSVMTPVTSLSCSWKQCRLLWPRGGHCGVIQASDHVGWPTTCRRRDGGSWDNLRRLLCGPCSSGALSQQNPGHVGQSLRPCPFSEAEGHLWSYGQLCQVIPGPSGPGGPSQASSPCMFQEKEDCPPCRVIMQRADRGAPLNVREEAFAFVHKKQRKSTSNWL